MQKIMFNNHYGLTRDVLDEIKTQTRRIANVENVDYDSIIGSTDSNGKLYFTFIYDGWHIDAYPTYQIGEEVAVAQCYFDCGTKWAREHIDIASDLIKSKGYNNKLFVRADLMPHRIRITNIRVERLQDISYEDCLKEGIKRKNERYVVENEKGVCFYTNDVILAFRYLIDNTCGKGTWKSNPWVFVYDFELVK